MPAAELLAMIIDDDADLSEVDEALRHLGAVPEDNRGTGWHALSNRALDRRRELTLA